MPNNVLQWSNAIRFIIAGLIAGPIAAASLTTWLPPATASDSVGESFIMLEATPPYVVFRNGCTTIRWDSANVREVYLNGEPTVGTGERELCVEPIVPITLRATLAEGNDLHAALTVPVLSEHPIVLGVSLFGALMFAAGVLTLPPVWRRVRAWDGPTSRHAIVVALVLVGALAVRIGYLNRDMHGDEAFTYLTFATQPLADIRADYSDVNNHILHNQLVRVSTLALGTAPWVIRLPAFIAGWLMVPLTYAIGRAWFTRNAALVAAAVVAFHPYTVNFSVNARGYTLMSVAVLLVLWWSASVRGRWWPLGMVGLAFAAAMGFATLSVFLYPMVGLGLWWAWVVWSDPHRVRKGGAYVLALMAGAGLTLAYYGAILQRYGFSILTGNRYVQQVGPLDALAANVRTLYMALASGWPSAVAWGVIGLALVGVVYPHPRPFPHKEGREAKPRNILWLRAVRAQYTAPQQIPLPSAKQWGKGLGDGGLVAPPLIIVVMLAVSLVLRYAMLPRGWLFTVPLWALMAGVGVDALVRRWRDGATVVALAMVLALGGWVTLTDAVLESDGTGDATGITDTVTHFTALRDAEPQLEVGVLALFSVEFPMRYTAQRYRLDPAPHILNPEWADVVGPFVDGIANGESARLFALYPHAATITVDDYLPAVPDDVRERFHIETVFTYADGWQLVELVYE